MSRTLKRPHTTAFPSTNTPYGTPLPDLSDQNDSGAFLPLWKQSAVDERGRKRFHGAFTGGWSAGYFNSVGSKEGFVPATFVSSRNARAVRDGGGQKVEDFMDEEDLKEREENERLGTARGFGGLGKEEDASQNVQGGLLGLMTFTRNDSIGAKLLSKMGWKEGQGIGSKVKRTARGEEGGEEHWFAPEDTQVLQLVRKLDRKGLGFSGETNERNLETEEPDEDDDSSMLERSKSNFSQSVPKTKKSSFGVGILNDTGSDEDDPYQMGPKISYNKTIGSKKAKKLAKQPLTSSNPLVGAKPVFLSKKKITGSIRKCHDGKLPLDGFVLSTNTLDTFTLSNRPPPPVPEGWKSSKTPLSAIPDQISSAFVSTAEASRLSSLDPRSRGAILGETPLPGKSIFSYLTPSARDRLANVTGKTDLPAALSEAAPAEFQKTDAEKQKTLWDFVPQLDASLAKSALSRSAGFMPYADDATKRARYVAFLEMSAGMRTGGLPERAKGHSLDEWSAEMREFAQAAQVFRPMTGLMASRFTSSSGNFEGGEDQSSENLLRSGKKDTPKDPAEEAARMGMFGPLTRSIQKFKPTRLVCKRLGVPVPDDDDLPDDSIEPVVDMPVSRRDMDRMMQESLSLRGPISALSRELPSYGSGSKPVDSVVSQFPAVEELDVEKNEALETERPGDAVFKAIFGDEDDDD